MSQSPNTRRVFVLSSGKAVTRRAELWLEHLGFESTSSGPGEAGVAAFLSGRFDLCLALMDVGPKSVLQTLARIRKIRVGRTLPVLAVTGFTGRALTQLEGFAAQLRHTTFLRLPLEWEAFVAAVTGHLGEAPNGAEAARTPPPSERDAPAPPEPPAAPPPEPVAAAPPRPTISATGADLLAVAELAAIAGDHAFAVRLLERLQATGDVPDLDFALRLARARAGVGKTDPGTLSVEYADLTAMAGERRAELEEEAAFVALNGALPRRKPGALLRILDTENIRAKR